MTTWLYLYWLSVALIVFTYFVFPLIVMVRGLLFAITHRQDDSFRPAVSLIIAAYNEAESIADKLRNIKELDYYDVEGFEAIIASDGSDDNTNEIVSAQANRKIRLLPFPRRGKADTLNDAVAEARGDILVFSDANSIYDRSAINRLVRHFDDDRIGGVAGNQCYVSNRQSRKNPGEVVYWNYDRQLKFWESAAGNTISATGAIYAIRRELFTTVPTGVTDDFFVSTRIIEQGYRLVFEPDAVAYEQIADDQNKEFGRKVRIMTRGLTGLLVMKNLFNPFRFGFYAFQLLVHKLLKRLLYLPLLAVFLSNLFIAPLHGFYQLTLVGQCLFYAAALFGCLSIRSNRQMPKPVSLAAYGFMSYLAAALASWNVIRGRRIVSWSNHRSRQ